MHRRASKRFGAMSQVSKAVRMDDALSLRPCHDLTTLRSFCQDHKLVSSEDSDGWVLHRDVIHAMILPVLQIHRQASRLADLLLRPNIAVDLELAFRGEARGTFTWLQCLLADEVDLCCTKSCPGTIDPSMLVWFSAVYFADTVIVRQPASSPTCYTRSLQYAWFLWLLVWQSMRTAQMVRHRTYQVLLSGYVRYVPHSIPARSGVRATGRKLRRGR